MWTRNYGALGQTARVCFGVRQVCPDVDKELWRLGPYGSGDERPEKEKKEEVTRKERSRKKELGKDKGWF
ncbi:hypothetical protein TNCV_3647491 [Trichonephila clavipes]|nr:hypothetical protein TNCV_3647491 [Trichonephila clavipes]